MAAAGDVDPMTGFAIAAQPGRRRPWSPWPFETDDQASAATPTAAPALAAGPAPGQGGDFADRFEAWDRSPRTATVLTMELEPVEGSPVLSDLSTGPVLFATC